MTKDEERKLARKIVRGVAKELRSHGFLHAKPTFLVRPFDGFAQFVHFHKFKSGPRFRVHFGVRVMNDPFDAMALNGPSFEHAGSYEANEEESFACRRKLSSLIEEEGLPWFWRTQPLLDCFNHRILHSKSEIAWHCARI